MDRACVKEVSNGYDAGVDPVKYSYGRIDHAAIFDVRSIHNTVENAGIDDGGVVQD